MDLKYNGFFFTFLSLVNHFISYYDSTYYLETFNVTSQNGLRIYDCHHKLTRIFYVCFALTRVRPRKLTVRSLIQKLLSVKHVYVEVFMLWDTKCCNL